MTTVLSCEPALTVGCYAFHVYHAGTCISSYERSMREYSEQLSIELKHTSSLQELFVLPLMHVLVLLG